MKESCCRLGQELVEGKNILYESNNFFIVPSVGPMGIKGYVLLCSKQHYKGIGDIPKEHESELEEVLNKAKRILHDIYNSEIIVFEHGPKMSCHRGGSCLDHAHLHLVPTSADVMNFLSSIFKPEKIKNFDRLRQIYKKQQSSYLFIQTQENKRYVIEVDFPIPSQYLRQVIASEQNISDWDWRVNPDYETFEKTLKELKNKF